MSRLRITGSMAVTVALLLAGCAATGASPTLTWPNTTAVPQDAAAFATLEKVAPGAARLVAGSTVEGTQCWTPSEHLRTDPSVGPRTVFRVICRVHYVLSSTQRYTDVVCIGDFAKDPMLSSCYIWKPHLIGDGRYDAGFEDGPGLASAPAAPLP
ncbi:hypothetical protein [Gryllotalpicola sp.]|uniref:hypothetical protein n=1 Tax=Gryllotalpicola sp. TaxID=1932787 RepID=UPI00260377D5|nr:hypothetical protein [Gryllotalpicola sp.]